MNIFVLFISLLIISVTCATAGGVGRVYTSSLANFSRTILVEDHSEVISTRDFVLQLTFSVAQTSTFTVKIGSDENCSSAISGLTASSTFTGTVFNYERTLTTDVEEVYVCISGKTTAAAYLYYTTFLGNVMNPIDFTNSAGTVEFASNGMSASETYFQFMIPSCLLWYSTDGSYYAPISLTNLTKGGQNITDISTTNSDISDFVSDMNKYGTMYYSLQRPYDIAGGSTTYVTEITWSSVSKSAYGDYLALFFQLPDKNSFSQTYSHNEVVFLTFKFNKCTNPFGIGCPKSYTFDIGPHPLLISSTNRYSTGSPIGGTIENLDSKHEISVSGLSWCPRVFKNNLGYQDDRVSPTPRRIVMWADMEPEQDPTVLDKIALYNLRTTSSVSDLEDVTYLPARTTYSQSGVYRSLSNMGYYTITTYDTVLWSFDVSSMSDNRPQASTNNYNIYMRAMVGYVFDYNVSRNTHATYSGWRKYALNFPQRFFGQLDSESEGHSYCVTVSCAASDSDCSPVLVYQSASDDKSAVGNVGYFTSTDDVTASTYCFVAGETDTNKYGYLLPMNIYTREWLDIETTMEANIDDVILAETTTTGTLSAAGFETKEFSAKPINHFIIADEAVRTIHGGVTRLEINKTLYNALTDDKQLTLTATFLDSEGLPYDSSAWDYEIRASQLCPRVGITCQNLTSTKEGVTAIAGNTINKDTEGDDLKYQSLYLRVVFNTYPDELSGLSSSYNISFNGVVEDKVVDEVDNDDADNNEDNEIDNIPDNDNNDEVDLPQEEEQEEEEVEEEEEEQNIWNRSDSVLNDSLGPLKVKYWIGIGVITILCLCAYAVIMKLRVKKAGENKFWSVVDADEVSVPLMNL